MINTIRNSVYQHGYLIIIAAWLYTISFIFSNYWSYHASPEKVKSTLEHHIHEQEKKINHIFADTGLLSDLINHQFDGQTAEMPNAFFGLFIYTTNASNGAENRYWSTNKMEVPNAQLSMPDGQLFITNARGSFVLHKKTVQLQKNRYQVIAVLPVYWSYFMENKYFQSDFAASEGLGEQYEISTDSNSLPVLGSQGNYLFSIDLKVGKAFIAYDAITILLRILAIVLLLFFCHLLAEELVLQYHFARGFGILVLIVLFLRLMAYFFHFPFDYAALPLFDPTIYASSIIHPSLGDLLINAVLSCWLLLFIKNHLPPTNLLFNRMKPTLYFIGVFIVFTSSFFGLVHIVQSLVVDAKISFDVTNIFSLNIYSVISFVILCFLALIFFVLAQILLEPFFRHRKLSITEITTVIVTGFVCLYFFIEPKHNLLYLSVLFWLVAFLYLLQYRKADMQVTLVRSPFFIFWVMIFAISIAGLVIQQNRTVEYEQRKRVAEKLAIQTDPSGESLLSIATSNFNNVYLANNFKRLEANELSNKLFKDSLINQNFSGYLNKYETRIYTFDSLFHPLFNEDSLNYASIKTIVLNQSSQTGVPDLYRFEKSKEGFSYIFQKNIVDEKGIIGYLYVLLKSKRYKSEALFPELFNQSGDIALDGSMNYAFAVYYDGKILNHYNNYNFPSELKLGDIPNFEFTYKTVGDYSELWYSSAKNRQVVVVKRNTWIIELVTLFAYLFAVFLIVIGVFYFLSRLIHVRFKWAGIKSLFRLNIRSQIQATILFVSVFSFIVIGIATISFFIYRYNASNEERLIKSIQVMANELNNQFVNTDLIPSKALTQSEQYALEKSFSDISDLHNVDINFYNESGDLVLSTQPYIYNKHLLSDKMDPIAFSEMKFNHRIRFLQSEKVGQFKYLSVYVPMVSPTNILYGYLNIPYLNSQLALNQEISGFLATLINLNAFILLLAGAIAFLLTNRITASLSLIGATMQKMNLGAKNQEIEWTGTDEIGVLVKEYNTMVRKLEQSVQSLAKSEREGAWREMARQVAHEIKNPLTPMKLSIQFLQKAINEDAPNKKELSSRMAATLIEQIDQLARIAGDFSQFANIGNTQLNYIDLGELIQSLVVLYQANDDIHFYWQLPPNKAIIYADKVQINRLFTNLLQNAIEAGADNEKEILISISLRCENNQAVVTINDQSGGISDLMLPHIFSPNFTTKTAGTGLGLAICKGIVEKANGQIHFTSKEGVGTSFTIQFPLAQG